MLYCLDTNIVIDLFRNDPSVKRKLEEIEQQQVHISISPIVLCELWQGVYLAPKQRNPTELIKAFLEDVEIIDFTKDAAEIYGKQYAQLKIAGKQTQEFDLMIASICIAHNAILITRNHKDFANIKDLKMVAW